MIRSKTIVLVMTISMIFTTTLFAGHAHARTKQPVSNAPANGGVTQRSATSSSILNTSGSGLSAVTFQNYTPWRIWCYVGTTFVGTVEPGQTLFTWTGSGWIRPNAQAVFLNRPPLFWDLGPVLYMPGGSYVFPMYP